MCNCNTLTMTYFNNFVVYLSVTRKATGIWKCKSCKKTMAGGAYVLSTAAAVTVRTAVSRLRKAQVGGDKN